MKRLIALYRLLYKQTHSGLIIFLTISICILASCEVNVGDFSWGSNQSQHFKPMRCMKDDSGREKSGFAVNTRLKLRGKPSLLSDSDFHNCLIISRPLKHVNFTNTDLIRWRTFGLP